MTTTSTRSNRRSLRSRLSSTLGAAGILAATTVAGVAVASPAQAAVYSYIDAGYYYSYAEAHTEGDARYSRSYAQHGAIASLSGWYSEWSYAYADGGSTFNYSAWNQFA